MRFFFLTTKRTLTIRRTGAGAGETTIKFVRPLALSEVWEWTWIDGREFRWQVPREGESSGWQLSGSDGFVWTGELHEHFLFWKSQGIVWTCVGQPKIVVRRRRLVRRFITVETDDCRMLAACTASGCTIQGVVRDSVAVERGPIVIVSALSGGGWSEGRTLIAG